MDTLEDKSLKILVTGSSGFIGRNLVKRLATEGHEIILLDRRETSVYSDTSMKEYICDVSDYESLTKISEDIDVIYHLAAQSGGYVSSTDPELDLDWNARGTLNICRFARERGVKKIVYTSTMAVYGEGDEIKEDHFLEPLSNYGVSKLCGEFYLKKYATHGIKYSIFRLFNTYGTHQNLRNKRQGVVAVFMSQVLKGKNIDVTGPLDRYRDITFVEDTVEGLLLGLDDRTDNQVYNICSNIRVTIREVVERCIEASGQDVSDFSIKNIGTHEGDQFGNTGNNQKLRSLGWSRKISLEEGFRRFFEYAEKDLSKT